MVGQYHFGSTAALVGRPGRHLVWVPASEARSVAGSREPLLTVDLPDGRPGHVVFEVETP
jgi:hypothetical protein